MSSKGQRDRIDNDFYETPYWVVLEMARVMKRVFGDRVKHVHDPFAGRGAILGPMFELFGGAPRHMTFSCTEIDPVRAEIANRECGGKGLVGFDAYETKVALPPGTVVVMNPPFIDVQRALDFAAVVQPKHDLWPHENVLGSIVFGPVSWRHSAQRRDWWLSTGREWFRAESPLPHRACCAWPCNGTVVLPDGKREKCPKIYPVGSTFDCPHCGNGRPKPGSDSSDYSIYVWEKGWKAPSTHIWMKEVEASVRKIVWFTRNEGIVVEPKPEAQEPQSEEPKLKPEEPQPEEPQPEAQEPKPEEPKPEEPKPVRKARQAKAPVEPSAKDVEEAKKRLLEKCREVIRLEAEAKPASTRESLLSAWKDVASNFKKANLPTHDQVQAIVSEFEPKAARYVEPVKGGPPKTFIPWKLVGERERSARSKIMLAGAASTYARARYEGDPLEEVDPHVKRMHARQSADGSAPEELDTLAEIIWGFDDGKLESLVDDLRAPPQSRYCSECGLPQRQDKGWECRNKCGGTSLDLTGVKFAG